MANAAAAGPVPPDIILRVLQLFGNSHVPRLLQVEVYNTLGCHVEEGVRAYLDHVLQAEPADTGRGSSELHKGQKGIARGIAIVSESISKDCSEESSEKLSANAADT